MVQFILREIIRVSKHTLASMKYYKVSDEDYRSIPVLILAEIRLKITCKCLSSEKMVYASGVQVSQRDRVNVINTRGSTRVESAISDEVPLTSLHERCRRSG